MKTNLQLELTDPERNALARFLDDRETKRMVTRSELKELVDGFMAGLVASAKAHTTEPAPAVVTRGRAPKKSVRTGVSSRLPEGFDLYATNGDKALEERLKDLPPHINKRSYCSGWNRARYLKFSQ